MCCHCEDKMIAHPAPCNGSREIKHRPQFLSQTGKRSQKLQLQAVQFSGFRAPAYCGGRRAHRLHQRSTLPEAEFLVVAIRAKGARLAVPSIVDLSVLAVVRSGVTHIMLVTLPD